MSIEMFMFIYFRFKSHSLPGVNVGRGRECGQNVQNPPGFALLTCIVRKQFCF